MLEIERIDRARVRLFSGDHEMELSNSEVRVLSTRLKQIAVDGISIKDDWLQLDRRNNCIGVEINHRGKAFLMHACNDQVASLVRKLDAIVPAISLGAMAQ